MEREEPLSEDEGGDDELSLQLEVSSEYVSFVVLGVVDSVAVVVCAVDVCAPIEPSHTTTPHASTKEATTAAITRRRIAVTRRARAARSSWALGMQRDSSRRPRATCEEPERILGMAVLFDLDGVLVDSRAAFLNSMRLALAQLELPPYSREVLLPCIGPPLKFGFSELLQTDPDDPRVDALIAAYRGHYTTISLTDTTVTPGLATVLDTLDGPLAVATSKPHHFAEPLLVAMGLREHFAVVAGPELDERAETKAQTITRALQQLGTAGATMIGDRSFDVVGAHANDIPCIGVTWGIGTREELEQAGADTIIDDPLELGPAIGVVSRL